LPTDSLVSTTSPEVPQNPSPVVPRPLCIFSKIVHSFAQTESRRIRRATRLTGFVSQNCGQRVPPGAAANLSRGPTIRRRLTPLASSENNSAQTVPSPPPGLIRVHPCSSVARLSFRKTPVSESRLGPKNRPICHAIRPSLASWLKMRFIYFENCAQFCTKGEIAFSPFALPNSNKSQRLNENRLLPEITRLKVCQAPTPRALSAFTRVHPWPFSFPEVAARRQPRLSFRKIAAIKSRRRRETSMLL
jgi:hypothetical protein